MEHQSYPNRFNDQFLLPECCSSSISSSSSTSLTTSSSPNRISYRWGPPLIRINCGCASALTSIRVQVDHRNASTDRSVVSSSLRERNHSSNRNKALIHEQKTCMCSSTSTTNPREFRCSLHRSESARNSTNNNSGQLSYQQWYRLYARRSAMLNSIMRIGTVEGDLVKQALASLVRPFSHRQRRRCHFHPRPSRLSIMSKAGD